ncbi:MAG TPA: nitrite reductase small subunit NirD [Puia sp.]|nr:nitrite reductase small subunit NirD [Puia sp.]
METTTINSSVHYVHARPSAPEPAGINWQFACRVEDVPLEGGACVLVEDTQIAIFHFARRGQWYATQNLCPHKQQMALSRGMTGSSGENNEPKVACPFHKKTFSLETGACLSGEDYQIRTFPIRIKNGKVYIGLL